MLILFVLQENLQESRSRLQNQQLDPVELGSLEALKGLQHEVQVLVERGLLRMERSPSGQLEVQMIHQERLRGPDQVLDLNLIVVELLGLKPHRFR